MVTALPPNVTPEAEDLVRKLAADVLATNPPDPRHYQDGFAFGITFDEPPPGSMVMTCDNCGHAVMIGPDQQKAMRGMFGRRPLAVNKALCAPCALALVSIVGDVLDVRAARDLL